MNQLITKLGIVLSLLSVSVAQAYSTSTETVELLSYQTWLYNSQTNTINLPSSQWRNVQKLFIQASGQNYDATFEVVVNGDVKGTIHVPGRDPSYVVTVGEVTNSIQLRHVSGSTVHIKSIQAVLSTVSVPCSNCELPPIAPGYEPMPLPYRNEASYLAREAIRIVDRLEGYASYSEYGTYLLPVKKAAARAYASSQARGPLSLNVREHLLALKQAILFSIPYIEVTFERDYAFELAIQLKSLGDRLDQMLR